MDISFVEGRGDCIGREPAPNDPGWCLALTACGHWQGPARARDKSEKERGEDGLDTALASALTWQSQARAGVTHAQ